jgi:hypothetical protein
VIGSAARAGRASASVNPPAINPRLDRRLYVCIERFSDPATIPPTEAVIARRYGRAIGIPRARLKAYIARSCAWM